MSVRFVLPYSNLSDLVSNLAHTLSHRQEELGRGFLIMQQQNQIEGTIARIDASMTMARQAHKHPFDETEREEAVNDIIRLRKERNVAQTKLDALLGNVPRIAPAGPPICAPPTPATSTSAAPHSPPGLATPGPCSQPDDADTNPSKRPRRSLSNDSLKEAVTQRPPIVADQDEEMPVHSQSAHNPSKLMAAHIDSQSQTMIKNPPEMKLRYTKGPDGTRGFRARREMRRLCGVDMSRHHCLSDSLPRNVQHAPNNALIFLGILLLLVSLIKTAAATSPFSMYALNANGLVNSAKLHHINTAINSRNPHAFTLSESKTNTKTGPNLPNGDYNIFEEPSVQADNHHLYKWGVALSIRKSLQIAQRVQISAAVLRGHVIAVDVVLQSNDGTSFTHRVIGAYAPWDPRTPTTRDFWPELTKLLQTTTTSWTLGGYLNATVSASERSSGGIEAWAQYLKFLEMVNGHDLWYNNPDHDLQHNWTSRAGPDATTGNIINRVVTSKRSYIDSEISVADHPQDFVPYTNHRAVVAKIADTNPSGTGCTTFPAFNPTLNKPRIKFPMRSEKHRHDHFRTLMDERLDAAALYDVEVNDDESFLSVYNTFTKILIPTSEEAYGRVTRFTGARLMYNRLSADFFNKHPAGQSFLQFATLEKRKLHRALFTERVSEIKRRKETTDRYKITMALKGSSTKRLITPGEYIELPITVNALHSDDLVSDPDTVKETAREYWSTLYHHDEPPNIPKPWLTTKSVVDIKQRVENDPFIWPRCATITDFRALLRKGTPRPAPGRDEWEKWLIKSLSDHALGIVLKLHNYIVVNAHFPGDLKATCRTQCSINAAYAPISPTGAVSSYPISLPTPCFPG
ncbi:hypothetical protein B0H13DRAFT_2427047 [Mycena leptocephala]|nr:hypothetical protein B0H13DRAFT_2427047 [Mycena leptocephala]